MAIFHAIATKTGLIASATASAATTTTTLAKATTCAATATTPLTETATCSCTASTALAKATATSVATCGCHFCSLKHSGSADQSYCPNHGQRFFCCILEKLSSVLEFFIFDLIFHHDKFLITLLT